MAVIIDSLGRRWDPSKHPRDRKGRFIRTFSFVRLFNTGGSRPWGNARVNRINDEGHIDVEVTALSRNNPDSANHRIGERFSASASNMESVGEKATISDARAKPSEDRTAEVRKLGFSDEDIESANSRLREEDTNTSTRGDLAALLTALADSRTNNDDVEVIESADLARSRDEDSASAFAELLEAFGVEPESIDPNAPDGLPALQSFIDKSNEDSEYPNDFTETIPRTLDREFTAPDGTIRGIALIGDEDLPYFYQSDDDGRTFNWVDGPQTLDEFLGSPLDSDNEDDEPVADLTPEDIYEPEPEADTTPRTEDDFLAALESLWDDDEIVLEEGESDNILNGYRIERHEGETSSDIVNPDGDTISRVPNNADNERLQQVAAKIFEDYDSNAPEDVDESEPVAELPDEEDVPQNAPEDPLTEEDTVDPETESDFDRLGEAAQEALLAEDTLDSGYVSGETNDSEGVQELLDAGLISETDDPNSYSLTPEGQNVVEAQIARDVDPDDRDAPEVPENVEDNHEGEAPSEGDGGGDEPPEEPPTDEDGPLNRDDLTPKQETLLEAPRQYDAGEQITEEMEELENEGLINIDRNVVAEDQIEGFFIDTTTDGEVEQTRLRRRLGDVHLIKPKNLTDEELQSEFERLESAGLSEGNDFNTQQQRGRFFGVLNEQRSRNGEPRLSVQEFRDQLYGPETEEVVTEAGETTPDEEAPEPESVVPNLTDSQWELLESVRTEDREIDGPVLHPTNQDMHGGDWTPELADDVDALERAGLVEHSEDGENGEIVRHRLTATNDGKEAVDTRDEANTGSDAEPAPEAPDSAPVVVSESPDAVPDSDEGEWKATMSGVLEDIGLDEVQVRENYPDLSRQQATNIADSNRALHTAIENDQYINIELQGFRDTIGSDLDRDEDPWASLKQLIEEGEALYGPSAEDRNQSRLDEIDNELDQIYIEMRGASREERSALREREDELLDEREAIENGGTPEQTAPDPEAEEPETLEASDSPIEDALQNYQAAQTDEERVLQAVNVLETIDGILSGDDVMSTGETRDEYIARYRRRDLAVTNATWRSDESEFPEIGEWLLNPVGNPKDVRLNKFLRDEQGQFRYLQRGIQKGTKIRRGDRVAVKFKVSDTGKEGIWIGTVTGFFGSRGKGGKIGIQFGDDYPTINHKGTIDYDNVYSIEGLDESQSRNLNPEIHAPASLDQKTELAHFMDAWIGADNQQRFSRLDGSEKLVLSNGYTLSARPGGEPLLLTLTAPDGRVVDNFIGVPGYESGTTSRRDSSAPGNPVHEFRDPNSWIDGVDEMIRNDEANPGRPQPPAPTPVTTPESTTPEPNVPTPEPDAPEPRSPEPESETAVETSEGIQPPNFLEGTRFPVVPTYSAEQIEAWDSDPVHRVDAIADAVVTAFGIQDRNDIVRFGHIPEGSSFDMGRGYTAVRTDEGWAVYSPNGLPVGSFLASQNEVPASDLFSALYYPERNDASDRFNISMDRESGRPTTATFGSTDISGEDGRTVGAARVYAAVEDARNFFRDNPGAWALPQAVGNGWSVRRNGNNLVFNNVNGSGPHTIADDENFTRDFPLTLGILQTEDNRGGARSITSDQARENTVRDANVSIGVIVNTSPESFTRGQIVPLGSDYHLLRNGDGWSLRDNNLNVLVNGSDSQMTVSNRSAIESQIHRFLPRPAASTPTVDDQTDRDWASEAWTEGETVQPRHVYAEAKEAILSDNDDPIQLLDGGWQITRTGAPFNEAVYTITRPEDGVSKTFRLYDYETSVTRVSDHISSVINQIHQNDLLRVPAGPAPEEVWGTAPDPDAARRVGARVRYGRTNAYGYVRSITASGNSARVEFDSGESKTVRVENLTGLSPESVGPNGRPILPVSRNVDSIRAISQIPNAGKLDEWLIASRLGESTPDTRTVKKLVQDILDASHMPEINGYTAKAVDTRLSYGALASQIHYYDQNGRKVGHNSFNISRDGNKIVISHPSMFLDDAVQGKLISEISNGALENWYRYNGAYSVSTTANGTIGTYAWGQQGFGWQPSGFRTDTVRYWMERISRQPGFDQVTSEDKAEWDRWVANLRRMDQEHPGGVITVDDLDNYGIPTPGELGRWGKSQTTVRPDGHRVWPGKGGLIHTGGSWSAYAILGNIPLEDPIIEAPEASVPQGPAGPVA